MLKLLKDLPKPLLDLIKDNTVTIHPHPDEDGLSHVFLNKDHYEIHLMMGKRWKQTSHTHRVGIILHEFAHIIRGDVLAQNYSDKKLINSWAVVAAQDMIINELLGEERVPPYGLFYGKFKEEVISTLPHFASRFPQYLPGWMQLYKIIQDVLAEIKRQKQQMPQSSDDNTSQPSGGASDNATPQPGKGEESSSGSGTPSGAEPSSEKETPQPSDNRLEELEKLAKELKKVAEGSSPKKSEDTNDVQAASTHIKTLERLEQMDKQNQLADIFGQSTIKDSLRVARRAGQGRGKSKLYEPAQAKPTKLDRVLQTVNSNSSGFRKARIKTWAREGRGKYLRGTLQKKQLRISSFLDVSGSFVHEATSIWGGYLMYIAKNYHALSYTFSTQVYPIRGRGIVVEAGGTLIKPVFDQIAKDRPQIAVIFTDGMLFDNPEQPKGPRYIWILPQQADVKYRGEKIHI